MSSRFEVLLNGRAHGTVAWGHLGRHNLQNALAETGRLLGVFALPLAWFAKQDRQPEQAPVLLMFFWLLLLVMAHIKRHALSSTLAVGLGVSLLDVLVSM